MKIVKLQYGIKPIISNCDIEQITKTDCDNSINNIIIKKSFELKKIFEDLIPNINKFLYIQIEHKNYFYKFILEENNDSSINYDFEFTDDINPITKPEYYKYFYYECSLINSKKNILFKNFVSKHLVNFLLISEKNYNIFFNYFIFFSKINPNHLFDLCICIKIDTNKEITDNINKYFAINSHKNIKKNIFLFKTDEELKKYFINKISKNNYNYYISIPCIEEYECEFMDPFRIRINDIIDYNLIVNERIPDCPYFIAKSSIVLDYFVSSFQNTMIPIHKYIQKIYYIRNYIDELNEKNQKSHIKLVRWYYSKYQILCIDNQYQNYLNSLKIKPKKYCTKNTICIFSHYDKDNVISYNCIDYINELEKYVGKFVLISNVDKNVIKNKIQRNIDIIQLDNSKGGEGYYDFGKYLYGINNYNIEAYDRVILANDSVTYLGNSLEKIFEWANNDLDVWSIIDCIEPGYHLQSWFISFQSQKSILMMKYYINSIKSKINSNITKIEFVYYCEILLSWWLWIHHFKISSYLTSLYMIDNDHIESYKNPSYDEWNIVAKYIPFVKKYKNILKDYVYITPLEKFKYNLYSYIRGKKCLEIGGPSIYTFYDVIPLYKYLNDIDNVIFSYNTIWSNQSNEYIINNKRHGQVFELDATNLEYINSDSYDIVLSSHNLEHIANPLKALKEWFRVLKPGGYLVIVLPKKEDTFDHKRKISSFELIKYKYVTDVGEEDLSSLGEILKCHDLERDPEAGSFNDFVIRSLNNYKNRCLHHHVFDVDLIRSICDFLNCKLVDYMYIVPINLYFVLKKDF